jgi:hypothetical protein
MVSDLSRLENVLCFELLDFASTDSESSSILKSVSLRSINLPLCDRGGLATFFIKNEFEITADRLRPTTPSEDNFTE